MYEVENKKIEKKKNIIKKEKNKLIIKKKNLREIRKKIKIW